MKAPLHGPTVPSSGGKTIRMTEPNRLSHPGVPDHQPAAGGIAARARAASYAAISRGAQCRAARGGRGPGRTGAGAGRRRHRQDPGADLAHRAYSQPGPRAPRRNPLGDLHQQGRARDEAAARPDARPGRGGHAMARHLSLHRRTHPAHPRRTGAVEIQFHRIGCGRPDPPAQAVAAGREYRRQALAGADAGRPDRRLEESRADALAGAARRGRGVRQRQGRQALRGLSGAAENSQRGGFRRSAAGEYPAVPRASGRAPAVSEPLQVHSGGRISGHQRRAISLAAAAGAGACPSSFREPRRRLPEPGIQASETSETGLWIPGLAPARRVPE